MSSEKKNNKATAAWYQKQAKAAKKLNKGEGIISKIVKKITGK